MQTILLSHEEVTDRAQQMVQVKQLFYSFQNQQGHQDSKLQIIPRLLDK
jgi:hypothetical protein